MWNGVFKNEDTNMNINNGDEKISLYDLNVAKPIENMPYIICPNCKNRVIADSNFCSSCGYRVSR